MYTALVVLHVISMIFSIGLMAGAIGLGFFGQRGAAKTATFGYVLSVLGFASGLVLLLRAPLTIECAILAAYLLATTLLYRYGFARGDASRARFIRHT